MPFDARFVCPQCGRAPVAWSYQDDAPLLEIPFDTILLKIPFEKIERVPDDLSTVFPGGLLTKARRHCINGHEWLPYIPELHRPVEDVAERTGQTE